MTTETTELFPQLITLENIAEKHTRFLELENTVKECEAEMAELKKLIFQFLSTNSITELQTSTGKSIKIRPKFGVTVGNKLQLIKHLLNTDFEGLVTINHQSFPKQYRENPEFFEPLKDECMITESEYSVLSI